MAKKIKVSVLCITYNQEKFIGQALESFMAQETDFNFEVLVHDDASTDRTRDIIKEFQKKYPHAIKPIFQEENQFSKGVRGILMKYLLPRAKGDYIAICDGDDFFTDKKKLQLQADFLDKHPDYMICFHYGNVFFENNEHEGYIYPEKEFKKFTRKEMLKRNFMLTSSAMYRRVDYGDIPKTNIMPGDWYLHLYHVRHGKIGFINRIMSSYRRHPGGVWWDAENNAHRLLKKEGAHHVAMYLELMNLYRDNPRYLEIIFSNINHMLGTMIGFNKKDGVEMIKEVLSDFPENMADITAGYVIKTKELVEEKEKISASKKEAVEAKEENILYLEKIIRKRDEEIKKMKDTKVWRVRENIVKIRVALRLTRGWHKK